MTAQTVDRDGLLKALRKIVDAKDGAATMNAIAEARGLLQETTLAFNLAKVGFAVWESGGGCTAWRVPLPFGYILITDMDGATHDLAFDSPALLGIYDNDDNAVTECWHSPRAADALSQARTILDAIVVDERAGADRIADAKAAIDAIDNALSGIER